MDVFSLFLRFQRHNHLCFYRCVSSCYSMSLSLVMQEHGGPKGSNEGRIRCRTFWGFERRRWYLINKETTKEGNKMLIVTVTNPQLQMVPLLQTTKRLWWSGNMMKDDYGSDDEEELFIKETPRELLNWIKIYRIKKEREYNIHGIVKVVLISDIFL